MSNGVMVGARGRMAVGLLLDSEDEEPRFRLVLTDFGAETCKEVSIDAAAAGELCAWLSQTLRDPRAHAKRNLEKAP